MHKVRPHAETLLIGGTGRTPRTLYLLTLLLAAALFWCHLTPIDVFVRAPGVVRPKGDVTRITSQTGGQVEVIQAREGDMVNTGDVLLHLNSRDERMRQRTLTEQIDVRELQLAHMRRKLEALGRVHSAEQSRLDTETRATRESLELLEADFQAGIEAARVRIDQAVSSYNTTSLLFEEGLVSREAWSESRTALRLSQLDYTRAATGSPDRRSIELLDKTRDVTASRFAADQEDLTAAMYPLEVELAELRLELDYALQEEERRTIRSPARGKLALMDNIHPGEHLAPGTIIGTLEPSPGTRVVEAVLANGNGRDIHSAQSVRLLLNDSEIVAGIVQSISPDVRGGNSAPLTYRVVIEPADTDLRLGLGVEVRFVTRTETVLSLLTGRITDSFRQLGG